MLRRIRGAVIWSWSGPWRRKLVGGPWAVLVLLGIGGRTAAIAVIVCLAFTCAALWMTRHNRRVLRWSRSLRLRNLDGTPPLVMKARRTKYGHSIRLRLPVGVTVEQVKSSGDALAGAYKATTAHIRPGDPGEALIEVLRRDPLATVTTSPYCSSATLDTRAQPLSIGVTESGRLATVNLFASSLLIGGNPGSGKSATVNNIVAAASCDPRVELWLVDAKNGVELQAFRSCSAAYAEDLSEALSLLKDLLSKTQSRFEVLKEAKAKKWCPNDGSILLVIDELAEITGLSSKESKEATETLRRIIALGRAAGVSIVAATQKPDATTVPTAVRDLFATRLGHRCGNRGQADVILPDAGDLLTQIPKETPGVGYLVDESGEVARIRSYLIDDADVWRIAARADEIRTRDALESKPPNIAEEADEEMHHGVA